MTNQETTSDTQSVDRRGTDDADVQTLQSPWSQTAEEALKQLRVDPQQGLDRREVSRRRQQSGANRLRDAQRRRPGRILLDQFKSVVLIVLIVAAGLAFAMGEIPEGIAVTAVVIINGLIGFTTEWQAVRSMDALRRIGKSRVRVRRQGQPREVSIDALVPGDVVSQEGGDVVPADLRLLEANNLRVDEAALTGESVSVVKRLEPAPSDAVLAARHSMLYRGTTITEGSAEGVVVATGPRTELGQIAELADQETDQTTPLQRSLDRLGSRLAWTVLGIAVLVALAGLIAGRDTELMIGTAIALGIAAVPEGLPIVATIALARGMWLMARRQALINRLTAVETLGSTRVIFTDKTGTLTQNRMTLRRVVTPTDDHELNFSADSESSTDHSTDDPLLRRVVEIGVLCSNASLTDVDRDGQPDQEQGDPTEVALLWAGQQCGMDREALLQDKPEVREVAFNPEVMMMATFHEQGQQRFEVAVKGAPQAVLNACHQVATEASDGGHDLSDAERTKWVELGEELAEQGLRVLAIADKWVDKAEVEPYESLRFVGLVGLYDPPAQGVKQSIQACQQAGIRVVMVTGDQPATAQAIGVQVGLADEDSTAVHGQELSKLEQLSSADREKLRDTAVFARVSPAQKLQLMRLFQEHGEVVAMTGDGINDTPALKKADIGVAMGRRGTDAARQAADMVLKDDAFSSIVAAVEQGRVIFGNIRKSIMFMLCTNVAEILAVTVATLVGLPLPLRPLQILFLNVVTDVFPALALGVGKGDPRVMSHPPRDPKEPLLTSDHWLAIGLWSSLIAACVLTSLVAASYYLNLDLNLEADATAAVTISFLTLGFSKLWFVLNLRDADTRPWDNDIVRNVWVWASIALCIVLLLATIYAPGLSTLLNTTAPGWMGWLCVLVMSLLPLLVGQIYLVCRNAWRRSFFR